MTQFEYIAVLVSVVTGLGVVRLLSGVAGFFNKGVKPYWVHLLWTWNVFHFIVFFWWFFWRWSNVSEWNLLLFLFVLIYAVALYLLCALLYPTGETRTDYEAVYYDKRRWFFGMWIAALVIDIVDTKWKSLHGLSDFGLFLIGVWTLIIGSSFVAAWTSNKRFHAAWAILFFLVMSLHEYLNFSTLRVN